MAAPCDGRSARQVSGLLIDQGAARAGEGVHCGVRQAEPGSLAIGPIAIGEAAFEDEDFLSSRVGVKRADSTGVKTQECDFFSCVLVEQEPGYAFCRCRGKIRFGCVYRNLRSIFRVHLAQFHKNSAAFV